MTPYLKLFLILGLALGVSACELLKASPIPSSSFLIHEKEMKSLRERAPVHGLWYKDRDEFYRLKKRYSHIYIAPVELGPLFKKLEHNPTPLLDIEQRKDEAKAVASYMREKFRQAIQTIEAKGFSLVEEPDEFTFVLEMAISELEPTNPIINAAGATAGFFFPGGGLISRFGTGSIALEARVRDGGTAEILVEFKDRESDPIAVFSLKDYQRYAHVRQIIDEWAEQYAELASTSYDQKVDDSLPFNLLPW